MKDQRGPSQSLLSSGDFGASKSTQAADFSSARDARADEGGRGMSLRALYSVKETRELLGGVSNTSFYAAVKRGEIRLTKLGRRTFVAAAEIQRIASGEAA